jgi:hypothetical protein
MDGWEEVDLPSCGNYYGAGIRDFDLRKKGKARENSSARVREANREKKKGKKKKGGRAGVFLI